MAGSLQRREFIKSVSLAGASIAITDVVVANSANTGEIKNDLFTVSFYKGKLSIYRSNGGALLTGGIVCVNTGNEKLSIVSDRYKHSVTSVLFNDQVGTGKRLVVFSNDKHKTANIEIRVSLYDQSPAITFEAICRNVSRQDLTIKSIEPLRVIAQEGGILHMMGVSKCITNGEMYFDAGAVHEFGTNENAVTSGNLKGVKLVNGSISTQSETIHSWWNAGLFSGYDKEGISIGYPENNLCLGNLLIARTSPGEIAFVAESVYAPELVLRPGKTISSNALMINIAGDPYAALENYASATGKINKARTQSIVNGWCSWFYTLSQVSEEEVLVNAEFAAEHLKAFGLEYIQIDEGFQKWHGEWEGNERFPHGMKWLANRIKSYGFKPGLWISPYVISEPTEVFQKHPEWLLKNADESLKRVGNWEEGAVPPADENPKRYGLDITHPGAANWLHDLIDTIVNDWGYEMIKIDFVAWTILAADHYYDPAVSAAQVYRKGMEIIRNAAGDKCHILDCGPGAVTTGLVDSMRIELDVNYGFADTALETYFLHPASSMSAAAKRFYFHKRTWVNDADHICMDLLSQQQSEAAATIIALSGGNMISGDRLTQLDSYKLEILKKITPSFGEAAIPVDLFDGGMQSVFALKIKKSFAEWVVVAFLNPSLTEAVEKKFALERLWLNPAKTYIAFDFWQQHFAGEITKEIAVTIQPGSVVLLALHEKTGNPQFISTDRHLLQGAVEIENVIWNEDTKALSGTSIGSLNTSHNVFVYVPKEYPWTWSGSGLFQDHDDYSLKLYDKHVIRVHVNFNKAGKVNWEIKPDDFSK